jgi:cytochrome b6-f complex iron-sulfur subunit
MSEPEEKNNLNETGPDGLTGPMDRRTFLKVTIGTLGAVYAGAVGYPIYRYLASPVEESDLAGAVTKVTLDNALDLPKNAALMFKFGSSPAMLIHHDDDSWTALSAVCTHLGCTPSYLPDRKVIYCPCHGGVYDANTGANISGPPPKPLTEFKVSKDNGKITISRT